MPGQRSGTDKHRATAGARPRPGELQISLCGRCKIDARAKTRTAPDEDPDMREPANQSRITDVSRLRSHRCTINTSSLSTHSWTGRAAAPPRIDMGHQSDMRGRLTPDFAPLHPGYGPSYAYRKSSTAVSASTASGML